MYKQHYKSDVTFHPIPEYTRCKKPGAGKCSNSPFDQLLAFLPDGTDLGDIILLVFLLLLYIDSHDEEFLIMLLVIGMSLFQR